MLESAVNQYSDPIALRARCLDLAITLGPKDAGDLIRKASGIYRWLMTNEKTVEDESK